MKKIYAPLHERKEVKSSDMRFATERLVAVSVSKPNSLLTSFLS